jgi:hypothetical protein
MACKGKEEEGKLEESKVVQFPTGLENILKPHQKEGIQFMWDNIVTATKPESGCIIAHAYILMIHPYFNFF